MSCLKVVLKKCENNLVHLMETSNLRGNTGGPRIIFTVNEFPNFSSNIFKLIQDDL